MSTTKIASSPTKERLQKLINEFYYSQNYIITDDNKVYNTKLQKYKGEVRQEKNQFVYYV